MESKIFNISSYEATNKSNFRFDLPSNYHNIAYMKIKSIEIPHTIYTFSSNKNNLNAKLTFDSVDYNIIISEGNYTANTIITEIQDKLNSINITTSQDFTISLNSINNKITIKNNTGNNFTLDFSRLNNGGDTIYPHIGYYLGFTEEIYSSNNTYTGINQLNLIDTNYIYLKINDLENIRDPIVHYSFSKIMLFNKNEANTHYIKEEDIIGNIHHFRNPRNIKSLNIKLVDYKDKELTLTPYNVTITLEIGYIYDSELYKKINHMKYHHNIGFDQRNLYLS